MEGPVPPRLRDLPSVHAVLSTEPALLLERFGRTAATGAVRVVLDAARQTLLGGVPAVPLADDLARQALAALEAEDRSGLRPLFNLTGTVLHTNFGRAVLAQAATAAFSAAWSGVVGGVVAAALCSAWAGSGRVAERVSAIDRLSESRTANPKAMIWAMGRRPARVRAP